MTHRENGRPLAPFARTKKKPVYCGLSNDLSPPPESIMFGRAPSTQGESSYRWLNRCCIREFESRCGVEAGQADRQQIRRHSHISPSSASEQNGRLHIGLFRDGVFDSDRLNFRNQSPIGSSLDFHGDGASVLNLIPASLTTNVWCPQR